MNNPAFKNVERPAYELPTLLKNLGDISVTVPMTAEQRNLADAAETHATNALSTLLDGIESVGRLLTQLGVAGVALDSGEAIRIGNLFAYLAVESQLMVDVQSDMESTLRQDSESSKKGGAK